MWEEPSDAGNNALEDGRSDTSEVIEETAAQAINDSRRESPNEETQTRTVAVRRTLFAALRSPIGSHWTLTPWHPLPPPPFPPSPPLRLRRLPAPRAGTDGFGVRAVPTGDPLRRWWHIGSLQQAQGFTIQAYL